MPDLQRWLSTHEAQLVEALGALVRTNSWSGSPEGTTAVARQLEGLFAGEGVTTELVAGARFGAHFVARTTGRPGAAPIALVGHHDTVFPPGTFEGFTVEGPRLRGPGVFDMKGGLALVAFALKALAATGGLHRLPPLLLVSVSDEEVGSPEGAALLRRLLPGAQACLVFEPGRSNDAVVTQRQGTGTVACSAHGVAAHAGNEYWKGVNAIWALARFVDGAQRLSDQATGRTVNVGTISGGVSKNTVPHEAHAEVDLRFRAAEDVEALVGQLERVAREAQAQVPGSTLTLARGPVRPPMGRLPGTDALLTRYLACAAEAGLGTGEAPLQGGGSDGNTAAALGIATLDALGPRGGGFHTKDEYVETATLLPRALALARFLAGA